MNKFFKYYKKQLSVFLLMLMFPLFTLAQMWQYEVVEGDTLWDVSADNFLDVFLYKKLQELNNVKNPYLLQPGTQLKAPLEWVNSIPGSAKIIAISGNVKLSTNQEDSVPLKENRILTSNDTLITSRDSAATIEFVDKSRMNVYSNTRLKFRNISQTKKGEALKAYVEVKKGRVDVMANPEKKSATRFQIQTPSAVTAVRGTSFRVGAEQLSTFTEVVEGRVAVFREGHPVTYLEGGMGLKIFMFEQAGKRILENRKIEADLLPAPIIEETNVDDSILGLIKWKPLDDVKKYRVRVATDDEFNYIIYDRIISSPVARDIYFNNNGLHYASVRGLDSEGIEGFDANVELDVSVHPLPPLPVLPVNFAEFRTKKPKLIWKILAPNVKQIHVQIAKDIEFKDLVIDEKIKPADRFKPSTKLEEGKYYWRSASISDEQQGAYSSPFSFTIK